jgi:hypothetical protein
MTPNKPKSPGNFYLWFQPKDGWQVTSFDPTGDKAILGNRDVTVYVLKSAYNAVCKELYEAKKQLSVTNSGWPHEKKLLEEVEKLKRQLSIAKGHEE